MGAYDTTLRPAPATRPLPWWLLLLIALAILLSARLAQAELRGAPLDVTEAGCDVAVTLEGPVARVTETHRLVSGGETPAVAAYTAPLPAGAVIDGFTVKSDGRDEPGVLVPAESLDNLTPTSLGLPPDLGTLRVGVDDGHPVIEARLYPISPSHVTGFSLRWSAPVTYAGGLMTLVFPARGTGDNLGRCRMQVEARGASGIRAWASVRAGGVWVGAGARVRGTVSGAAPSDAFAIEARPTWSSAAPVLAVAHAPASGERVPSTLAIYVPDTPARAHFAPARLLFLVDTSRSVGEDGRRAAIALIETLTRAAPAGTPVEAVLFDRVARRALGTWIAGNTGGLARVTRAVREAPVASGTDLAAALALAGSTLAGEAAHVVIITDGVIPTAQSATELLGALAAPAGRVVVDVLIPLAPGAAAPERGALESLTQIYGGRVVAFPADRAMPTAALTEGLVAGLPISELTIEADGVLVGDLDLPDILSTGTGVVVTTSLARRPRGMSLHARRGAVTTNSRAIALPAGAERFAVAALTTAVTAEGSDGTGLAGGSTTTPDDAATEVRALPALARRLGVLGIGSAMLVIDRRAAGGTARHDLARRTGAITYTAPPQRLEREVPTPAVKGAAEARARRVGELPLSSVQLALRDQLLPRVRICYRDALRSDPSLGGRLTIELEIARAEVMAVNLSGDHFPEALIGCIADVAYNLTTPSYELGGQPDTVFVVRKPLQLRAPASADAEPTVSLDDVLYPATNPAGRPAVEVETDAPL